jgi:hypothetical protein
MKKNVLVFIIAVIMLFSAMPVMAQGDKGKNQESGYNDISDCWCKESVLKYGFPEIFSKGDGKFNPDKKITRMEFVRMLHKALNININYFAATDIKDYFNDVKNEDIGVGNLYDLVTVGIIDRKDSFGPDKQLDRDEMIHYIINALDYVTGGEYAIIQIMPEPFKDDEKINPEYKSDVNKAVILKLIFGRENNMLFPKEGATRAEAAAVISRLVDLTETLKADVAVEAAANEVNGELKISLAIENNTDKAVTIHHNSGQKYDFVILDSKGEILYQWSANKRFIMELTETVINPGEKVEFTDKLDSAAYGRIKENVNTVKAYIVGTSQDFEINTEGYEAQIPGLSSAALKHIK